MARRLGSFRLGFVQEVAGREEKKKAVDRIYAPKYACERGKSLSAKESLGKQTSIGA